MLYETILQRIDCTGNTLKTSYTICVAKPLTTTVKKTLQTYW